MKNKSSLLKIIAFLAIICFSIAACDSGGGDGSGGSGNGGGTGGGNGGGAGGNGNGGGGNGGNGGGGDNTDPGTQEPGAYGSRIAYSSDGINWTTTDYAFVWMARFGVVWGGDKFIVFTKGSDKTAYSADGISWTEGPKIFEGSGINDIAWGGGTFVAVGFNSRIAYSSDGLNWTDVDDTTFGTRRIAGVAWGDDRFNAIGVANASLVKTAYSSDGINWTAGPDRYNNGFTSNTTFEFIAYANGMWFGAGGWYEIRYSADGGMTWAALEPVIVLTASVNDITWGGGAFVAVGQDGKIAYSANGRNWTVATSYPFGGTAYFSGKFITGVAYGNGQFIAVGEGGIAYSDDGASWTKVENNGFLNNPFSGIIWGGLEGNQKFVMVGMGN